MNTMLAIFAVGATVLWLVERQNRIQRELDLMAVRELVGLWETEAKRLRVALHSCEDRLLEQVK